MSGPQPVTEEATWTSSTQDVATISDAGVITWLTTGTTEIRATHLGVSSQPCPVTYTNCATDQDDPVCLD